MKKRIFSGIQPSGDLHLGNYLGALRQWEKLQGKHECLFCIVDLHALTISQEPQILKNNINKTAALVLACGIDTAKSSLFVQSQISAHAELAWLLNCITPLSWMQRMTQYKEKSRVQKQGAGSGLLTYPVLMAADILLYDTDLVPVGEDQKQHLELTRDIARQFNSLYGRTFKLPEALIPEKGARIMCLDNPTKKMAKSEKSLEGVIYLLDSPAQIRTKIMKAKTDSGREISFDPLRPGIYNLLTIYELLTLKNRSEIEAQFGGRGYADFKRELAQIVIETLRPIQQRYRELTSDPLYVDSLLSRGRLKVKAQAERTLRTVKEKMGIG